MRVVSIQDAVAEKQKARAVHQEGAENQAPPFSLHAQAVSDHAFHVAQAKKAAEAANFLAANPAFADFILLIRQGAIQV